MSKPQGMPESEEHHWDRGYAMCLAEVKTILLSLYRPPPAWGDDNTYRDRTFGSRGVIIAIAKELGIKLPSNLALIKASYG